MLETVVDLEKRHIHEEHAHAHSQNCGHVGIMHDDHVDYLHDGHLHNVHEGYVDEHQLSVDSVNPAHCTPYHDCSGHHKDHQHGEGCGHEAVPHGDHTDYVVYGHLHHFHVDHCDDHGPIQMV